MSQNGKHTQDFKIIAVDDEPDILELYAMSLMSTDIQDLTKSPRFEVQTCRQGNEAVDEVKKARAGGCSFAVAFIDMHMPPGPDGLETAEQIRAIDDAVEIVMVTGYPGIDLAAFSQRVPPMNKFLYLQKPVYVEEIQQFALSLSSKWMAEKQYRQMTNHLDHLVEKRTSQLLKAKKSLEQEASQRALVEDSLRVNEMKFRNIIQDSVDAILILDNDGRITFVNPAGEKLLQRKKSDCVGTLFGYPTELGNHTDINLIRKDGKPVYAEMRAARTEWEGETAYLATLRDVTTRKVAEDHLKESLSALQATMHGTIEAFSRAVETRDPYTAGHQKQVAKLALEIAGEMNLDRQRAEGIYMAAMIHDLGKLSTPSDLLSKPTRLSEPEFELIKTHSQKGFDIIRGIDFPWPVADIVRQHHEKIDGSGYPSGLKGDQIRQESKILTVADVVDAMGSHRPYRPALGIEKAMDEIKSSKGKLYAPPVVDACVSLFENKGYTLG